MGTKVSPAAVTPSQAKWILERLIAERRISAADVRSIVSELGDEIADIEQRLRELRQASGDAHVASPKPRSEPTATKDPRKRTSGRKKGHVRGIAGTLVVLLRSIPAAEHAAIAAIREKRGLKAAIKAARAAAKTAQVAKLGD